MHSLIGRAGGTFFGPNPGLLAVVDTEAKSGGYTLI
ncbi:hypothetical protein SAMN05444004_11610 [Jannaschia faecimaris]|uniref:Uncharacterized protein n=1 Tax=Jannaschia faecimaris TaxID=1244108 RepID=A0A1H3TB76_9RHOB|nr:hypothetical protein SAMN05444004_11610 [Jannaschia faecimaris]